MVDTIVSLNALATGVTPSSLQIQTASMAAHDGRGGNDVLPIRFFKTILKTNIERLKIPNKFAMRYGPGLPNPLFMKLPDGTQWNVYWSKQNGEVWLEKGWKEFVHHYSLDQGHVVFFKYERTSHIDVLILDKSSLEIGYPSCDKCDDKNNLDMSDDESVTILHEWPNQKAKQMKGETPTQRTSSLNWPKQTKAKEVARNFISYNPFFHGFNKACSCGRKPDGRIIPDLKGIIEDKKKYVTLQLGEKSWNVKLFTVRKPYTYCRLSGGWSLFTSETELQPGDVCVFELLNKEDLVFKVHIFKK